MGQAKRRGTFEERRAAAISREVQESAGRAEALARWESMNPLQRARIAKLAVFMVAAAGSRKG